MGKTTVIRKAPWHTEYYCKALEQVAATTGQLCVEGDCAGWLAWFEQNHPGLFQKYENALDRTTRLWGSMKPSDMEEFKSAVKVETDALAWAIPKFIEQQAMGNGREAISEKQEAFGL